MFKLRSLNLVDAEHRLLGNGCKIWIDLGRGMACASRLRN